MRSAEQQMIEKEINGCQTTLSFSAKSVCKVIEMIQLFYKCVVQNRKSKETCMLCNMKQVHDYLIRKKYQQKQSVVI